VPEEQICLAKQLVEQISGILARLDPLAHQGL
jgi:hypothetical protein